MSPLPSLVFFYFHLLLLLLLPLLASAASPFTKLLAFGDSFTDTGNTHTQQGPAGFGFVSNPPYGATFFRHSTNRYSDGRLIIDFLAETLHLPFLPPYRNRSADFSHGANFAVAGSTILDHEFFVENNITIDLTPQSLGTQLRWFEHYMKKEGRGLQMEEALFWVGEIGVNDFAYTVGSTVQPEVVRALAIKNVTNFLEALLDKGAKHMVVQGQPMIGCLPLSMTLALPNDRDDVGCVGSANSYTRSYNMLLLEELRKLRRKYPCAIISYADYFAAHHTIMRNPAASGFTEPFKACCGSGGGEYNFDVFATCGSPAVQIACAKPRKYVNWDGVHLTEAAYKVVADLFFHRKYCRPPLPIVG